MMKTISEHLTDRRHERIQRAIITIVAACLCLCIVAVTGAVVVKTARLTADAVGRCADAKPTDEACAGPAW